MRIVIKDDFDLYQGHKTAVINPGLTFIAGCNGSGKSTFVQEVARNCRNKRIALSYLDCRRAFNLSDLEQINTKYFNLETVIRQAISSEYEHYQDMFADWISKVRPGNSFEGKRYVVVIDGLDSGGDIVHFETHLKLFSLMVKDADSRGIEIYVLVTCNNFYYLSRATEGEVLFMPEIKRRKLPCYSVRQYERYIKDMRQTAVTRGFVDG